MTAPIHPFSGRAYAEHRKFWQQQAQRSEQAFHFRSAWHGDTTNIADADHQSAPTHILSEAAWQNVKRLSGGRALEGLIVLLSAWLVVLARYTHQDTVVLKTPLLLDDGAGPRPAEKVSLVTTLSPTDTIRDLILKVNQTVVESYRWQHFPLEVLQQTDDISLDGLTSNVLLSFEGLHAPAFGPNTDHLHLHFSPTPDGGLQLSFTYSQNHFDGDYIIRLNRHFQNLLMAFTDVSRPLSQLTMLDDVEWQQVVVDWNQTRTDYPRDSGIDTIFQRQVQANPAARAVVDGSRSLSYGELDQAAARIAMHLQQRYALKTNEVVALVLEPSAERIIAILGVLKSGAAFLPIEPDNPALRISFMLQDAGARVVITSRQVLAGATDKPAEIGNWLLLEDLLALETSGPAVQAPLAGPRDLAYIMYTSGSTGNPKGVQIEQRSVVRLVKNTNYVTLTPRHQVLQLSSYAFDGSTFEIFGALLNGACLHVLSRELMLNPQALTDYVQQQNITVSFITTALFNNLVDAAPEFLAGFDYLLTGGQEVSPRHFRLALAHTKNDSVLQHVYGPTEGTTFSTWYVPREVLPEATSVPIGWPLANSKAYILDQQGQPVPPGVEGELVVGGDGIARGYVNRPELTAQKFFPSPFDPADRLYRTGDICCFDEQGRIHFRGRRDQQVKIRGFRIEPAEISRHILEETQAEQVFITSRVGANGNRELLAYIVMPAPPRPNELRRRLQVRLPDYMIPSYLMFLDEMPVNQNGKVDLHRLPAPEDIASGPAENRVAPETEAQHLLANAWEQVLNRSGIGIHDNYFTMGGDSIKAIQIAARLHQAGWKLELRQLFQHPTIATLAEQIHPLDADREPFRSQEPVTGDVPLTPIQHWFFTQGLRHVNHFNQAALLKSTSPLNLKALEAALQAVYLHHDALRMEYTGAWPQIQQQNRGPENPLTLQVVDLRSDPDPACRLQEIAARIQASLSLAHGMVLQTVLMHLPDGDRLLLAIHHLVVDGVSWRILLEDLVAGYQQYLENQIISLPPKTHSFKHWAEALAAYSRQETLRAQKPYWQDVLARPVAPLPARPTVADLPVTFANAWQGRLHLSAADTRRLQDEVNAAYNTHINDILLTALARALNTWHGGNATRLGLEGHGRVDVQAGLDVSRTVGWFTSLFPVVLELPPQSALGYQIRFIKEHLRKIPDVGIGYGVLRYLSSPPGQPDPDLVWHPQITFNYLGDMDSGNTGSRWLEEAPESFGPTIDSAEHLFYDLEITGSITRGQLEFNAVGNPQAFAPESLQDLMDAFKMELEQVIQHCASCDAGSISPSDIDYDGLDIDELDEILNSLEN